MPTTIRDIMTTPVITLKPEEDLMHANAIMQRRRVRHLPVVRDDKLLGLITQRDLLRAQIQALGHAAGNAKTTLAALPAAETMRRGVLTTTPDETPSSVARAMLDGKIGCVPVVEEDELVGILTEADFVKWALERD